MRKTDKGEVILSRVKASEIFLVLGSARLKLAGKMKTMAQKYWEEFEDIFELKPRKNYEKSKKG